MGGWCSRPGAWSASGIEGEIGSLSKLRGSLLTTRGQAREKSRSRVLAQAV